MRRIDPCRRPGRFLSALLVVTIVAPLAAATTYLPLTVEEMLERAEIAFVGVVETVRVEDRAGEPWTVVAFRVEEAFLGAEKDALELAFLGGELPSGRSLAVSGMPRFEEGERVLLLAYDEPAYSPVVGFAQGLWRERGGAFVDEADRPLGLGAEGRLEPDGPAAATEDVLAALRARFGREAP